MSFPHRFHAEDENSSQSHPSWGAVERRDVEFSSDGSTCRAWAYAPHRAALPAPCIVMAHGLGGTRAGALEPYAERFAAGGFNVLLFDYRFLGDSDGEPRQLISVTKQLEDWASAIAYARSMPGVDADRIALWGTSLSGGHVIASAARDERIAAVAAQCPMLDGAASALIALHHTSPHIAAAMSSAAVFDMWRSLFGLSPYYVPLVGRPGKVAAMATEDAYDGCMAIMPEGWRNEIAPRLFLSFPFFRPVRSAHSVRCPTLFIACADDKLVSNTAVDAAARLIGDKAEVVTLPIGHFDIYKGEWFERSSAAELAFYEKALLTR